MTGKVYRKLYRTAALLVLAGITWGTYGIPAIHDCDQIGYNTAARGVKADNSLPPCHQAALASMAAEHDGMAGSTHSHEDCELCYLYLILFLTMVAVAFSLARPLFGLLACIKPALFTAISFEFFLPTRARAPPLNG